LFILIVLLAFVPHASTAEKRVAAELELLSEEDANRTEVVSVNTNVSLDVLGPSTSTRNKFSERIEDNEIEGELCLVHEKLFVSPRTTDSTIVFRPLIS
jgi:hypothetical protein